MSANVGPGHGCSQFDVNPMYLDLIHSRPCTRKVWSSRWVKKVHRKKAGIHQVTRRASRRVDRTYAEVSMKRPALQCMIIFFSVGAVYGFAQSPDLNQLK